MATGTFEDLTKAYIDSMPPRSKVNYPDLVDVVMERFAAATAAEQQHPETQHLSAAAWTSRDRSYVNEVVHRVVEARDDLTVERGRGICKR